MDNPVKISVLTITRKVLDQMPVQHHLTWDEYEYLAELPSERMLGQVRIPSVGRFIVCCFDNQDYRLVNVLPRLELEFGLGWKTIYVK